MPVINFKYSDLCGLIGKKVSKDVLIERIPMMGADMHDTDGGEDDMSVEFFPDRPDLYSVEGLARSLRAFLDIEPGMAEYDVEDTDIAVKVDRSVNDVRPHIVCAVILDIEISDDFLRSLMEVQEKLHLTIGRKRSKVSIGVHDLDTIVPPFTYKAVLPHEISFVPLAKTEKWDLEEILKKHEKGVDYAYILAGKKRYPILLDANNDVLSFPPIINGTLTTVTTETRNLFIDVTGTDMKAVKGALDILVTALAERGGTIGSVRMTGTMDSDSPDLTPSEWRIDAAECAKFIGKPVRAPGIVKALRKMGLDAIKDGKEIFVLVPPTRLDIMHPVDIYEDAAIGYGFENFGSAHTYEQTVGKKSDITKMSDRLRDVMVGLGYTEVTTLTLSSEDDEFVISGLPERKVVKIKNPITEDHTCLRSSLLPSVMRIIRRNKHRDLPQRIFEIGDALTDSKRHRRLCAVATHSKTSFTEMKSVAESVLREMRIAYTLRPCPYGTFIEGRGAEIVVSGSSIGYFGEMSPRVITNFDVDHPVIFFEMDLTDVAKNMSVRLF
ncbi:MAG: phenylalanine--tRNA ligase subunit beta [Methanomassiliicoccaceae archaeon]|jgi:phenylalanyl-tRNA synthetase beta chain|nr:phenylalanine--tRNA ligase subunit beta [Methanomassiliicoccaceae archaeon]